MFSGSTLELVQGGHSGRIHMTVKDLNGEFWFTATHSITVAFLLLVDRTLITANLNIISDE